jgi:hypothetical protein
LAGGTTSPPQAPAPAAEDDEWDFASSLPPSNALPTKNQVQVLSTQLRVDFLVQRVPAYPRQIFVKALFSNPNSQPIGDLHFQVAVEKVSHSLLYESFLALTNNNQAYTLHLKPQTGRDIAPQQQQGVSQEMVLDGVDSGKGNSVKIRFKVAYKVGGEAREEQGMVPALGVN